MPSRSGLSEVPELLFWVQDDIGEFCRLDVPSASLVRIRTSITRMVPESASARSSAASRR